MMTSAAPTYFNPHMCYSLGVSPQKYVGSDGGLFANHPGQEALRLVKERYPSAKILMISLGTGMGDGSTDADRYHNFGLMSWAKILPEMVISAVADKDHVSLVHLAQKDPNFEYVRIQTFLNPDDMKMDLIEPRKLERLVSAARASIDSGGLARESFDRALLGLSTKARLNEHN
jgi:transketolase C-terminal domain/subunit